MVPSSSPDLGEEDCTPSLLCPETFPVEDKGAGRHSQQCPHQKGTGKLWTGGLVPLNAPASKHTCTPLCTEEIPWRLPKPHSKPLSGDLAGTTPGSSGGI